MLLFFKKIFVFILIPLVVFTFLISYVGYRSKEFLHLDKMIEIQQEKNTLVNPVTQYTDQQQKYKTTALVKPDILALGTSRIHQIRASHFADGTRFYNAALAVQSFPQYIDFLNKLETNPQFIILNIDQMQFNEKFLKNYIYAKGFHIPDEAYNYKLFDIITQITRMLIIGQIKITQKYPHPENMGLTAVVHGEGFRKDGSYDWNRNEEIERRIDNAAGVISAIDKEDPIFSYGDEIYIPQLEMVAEILRICKERNITVIAFLPPFAPKIYAKMMDNGHYGYISKVYPALVPLFNQYGYELYDFTDGSGISDDTMYFDGYHPDEWATYNMLLSMQAQNSALAPYIREKQ
jgi:hypothetical protein